jgi:adenine-specific DNA glycosylase
VTVPRGESPGFKKHLSSPHHIGSTKHTLTHRRYTFDIYTCNLQRKIKLDREPARAWVGLEELDNYPLPRPHLTIAAMLADLIHDVAPVGRRNPK